MLVGFQECPGQLAPYGVLTSVWVMGQEHDFVLYPFPELLKDRSEEKALGRILSNVIVAETNVREWWGLMCLCVITIVQVFWGFEVFLLYK